ncbi:hypothetical protein GPECTOR_8g387 [Gonium pectorale]|uniref:Uncharacterized protein n=1 Tax=Gonium pectorale TaxID=33097 RepID=A0A150GT26_GONPE|nr:hypothetical protein GPECTOR_8g387 [Gonium pectorale]|eukprot:KXZ53019.1 hypothetical protein GPECTOR_8g387 [Gonium pectorale]
MSPLSSPSAAQRFQRALNVDSVNVELPPIKELDVQPDPVRVESVLSRRASSRRGAATPLGVIPLPNFADDSRRQWQQFMAASRTTEVTNVSGSQRSGRGGKAEDTDSRPYTELDDRALADISERIRRANEGAAGGAVAAPVITFEQLYASNTETDDEAMARRAAERKARWQQKQGGAAASAAPSGPPARPAAPAPAAPEASSSRRQRLASVPPEAAQDAQRVTVPPPVTLKPRDRPSLDPSNPFARGLIAGASAPAQPVPSSSGSPQTGSKAGRGGAGASRLASPLQSEDDAPSSSSGGAASLRALGSPRDSFAEQDGRAAAAGALSVSERLQRGASISGARSGLGGRMVDLEHLGQRHLDPSSSPGTGGTGLCSHELSDFADSDDESDPVATSGRSGGILSGGDEQRQRPGRAFASTASGGEQQLQMGSEESGSAVTSRLRRAVGSGPLRTPDASDPSLTRLMRRPSPSPQ